MTTGRINQVAKKEFSFAVTEQGAGGGRETEREKGRGGGKTSTPPPPHYSLLRTPEQQRRNAAAPEGIEMPNNTQQQSFVQFCFVDKIHTQRKVDPSSLLHRVAKEKGKQQTNTAGDVNPTCRLIGPHSE